VTGHEIEEDGTPGKGAIYIISIPPGAYLTS